MADEHGAQQAWSSILLPGGVTSNVCFTLFCMTQI